MPIRNPQIIWKFPDLTHVPGAYQLAVGGSPLVAKTLYQRGLTSPEKARAFINPDLYTPCPPSALPGVGVAADRIIKAIKVKERILIWGDFDVDGQTSTTLLSSALQSIGARVTHHIPIRALENHGVTLSVLSQIIQKFSPNLILTCDTGIDAVDSVAYANRSGIDVIITDHHQLPPVLPEAFAIVNPNFLQHDHALHTLPGVGVAFKLVEQIYSYFNEDPSYLLDLVALGIVADVAIQTRDTRYLLQLGLDALRKTPRKGLLEICKMNDLDPAQVNEEHIGFVIGPLLNALGRLDDANSCVDFFTTTDPALAATLAEHLKNLNEYRQALTKEIYQDAENMIAAYPELVDEYPVLVLQGSPQWHPGVIGIVASRLVDRYHKPVIMLSRDGDQARGSARSIQGVPIAKLISASEGLLTSHGGHPMAAGMSLPLTSVSQFRMELAENYHRIVGDSLPSPEICIDAEIPFSAISESFIKDFQPLAPFGAGNPKLTFATRGVITDEKHIRNIGRDGTHRKITFTDSHSGKNTLLWWNSADLALPEMPLDVAYSLELSTYRNQTQIQATLLHLRQSPESPVYLPKQNRIRLVDLRDKDDRRSAISQFLTSDRTIIWAENQIPEGFTSVPRSDLSPHDRLIIWTTPPSRLVLKQAVSRVSPNEIIIAGVNPPSYNLEDFIKSLLGLVKHLKRTGKAYDLTRFAQALAYPEDVIEVGLEWIQCHGEIDLADFNPDLMPPGHMNSPSGFPEADIKLNHLLREVKAYRSYFNKAHIRAIL